MRLRSFMRRMIQDNDCNAPARMGVSSRAIAAGLGVWVIGVAALTLHPTSLVGSLSLNDFLCVWCSSRPGADKILNLFLFIPGGFTLAALFGVRRAIAFGLAITVGIETAQVWIPGRHPSMMDVVVNAVGAATGAWIHQIGPTAGLMRAMGAAAACLLLAPAILLAPNLSEARLVGHWAPQFRGQPAYSGEILGAEIGGHQVRDRATPPDMVRSAIARRSTVVADLVAGSEPAPRTPLFGLWDEYSRMAFTVFLQGADLEVSWWGHARTLGLEHPGLRMRDAFASMSPGDTLRLEITHRDTGWCVVVARQESCDVAPDLSEGWALLIRQDVVDALVGGLISVLWVTSLGVLIGMVPATAGSSVGIGMLAAGSGLVAGGVSPDVTCSPVTAGLLVAGACIGALMRRPFSTFGPRWTRSGPPSDHPKEYEAAR